MPADPLVKEFSKEIRNSNDWDEHSLASRSKKVIPGPSSFAPATADAERSIAPITHTVGAAADVTLIKNKAYRVIADVDVWFILKADTSIAGTAVIGTDIYLPAKTPMIISTAQWNVMNVVGAAGNLQAVEVL